MHRPKQDKSDSSAAEKRLQPTSGNNGVLHEDNSQCQFDPSTFKILYVINSENTFYRRMALNRAKLVSFYYKPQYPISFLSRKSTIDKL